MRLCDNRPSKVSANHESQVSRMTTIIKPMTEFAADLESKVAGRISVEKLQEIHPRDEFGKVSKIIWGNLDRYFSDSDAREKDSQYAHMQIGEMRKLVKLMETGGSLEDFSAITFVSRR